MEKPPQNQLDKGFTAYAIYGTAGIQLAVSVVAGLMLGNYADERLGTAPWLLIIGLALGFAGGLVNLVRIVGVANRVASKKGEDR